MKFSRVSRDFFFISNRGRKAFGEPINLPLQAPNLRPFHLVKHITTY